MSHSQEEPTRRAFRAELINDAGIDCVLTLDRDLKITSWNRMCETLSRRPKETVLGKRLQDIYPVIGASREFSAAFRQALQGRKSFVPAEQGSLEGEYMESHVVPLTDPLEQVTGILIIRHDVAHRLKVELELKRLNVVLAAKNRELEQKNAELIAFAHVTSHDLKEPLRKIRVFSGMLLNPDKQQTQITTEDLSSKILKSAKQAESLVDDIFMFTHVQHTSQPERPVKLGTALKGAMRYLEDAISQKNASVEATTLPTVSGHHTLLQQLFQNLLDNALKFQPENHTPCIIVTTGYVAGSAIRAAPAEASQEYVSVSIADNGIGFEREDRERIFTMFRRLHAGEVFSGNGIGLSLCRKIMELHRGFITAEGAPGQGSTFTLYFPVAGAPSTESMV